MSADTQPGWEMNADTEQQQHEAAIMSLIQAELKAPKGQFNSFGKYKYRSCEDIVNAVKPILAKHGCYLVLSDDIINIGDRFYIRACASVMGYGKTIESTCAYAREPESKKGMDESQITGTASSYARKYALNGLLAIDDTKDADTDEHKNQADEADPMAEHNKAVRENMESIQAIKDGIATDDIGKAAEAWFELDDDTKRALWVAPSKGGIFSTEERTAIKDSGFRKAYYGDDK